MYIEYLFGEKILIYPTRQKKKKLKILIITDI